MAENTRTEYERYANWRRARVSELQPQDSVETYVMSYETWQEHIALNGQMPGINTPQ
jgi:hypothetical protein